MFYALMKDMLLCKYHCTFKGKVLLKVIMYSTFCRCIVTLECAPKTIPTNDCQVVSRSWCMEQKKNYINNCLIACRIQKLSFLHLLTELFPVDVFHTHQNELQ